MVAAPPNMPCNTALCMCQVSAAAQKIASAVKCASVLHTVQSSKKLPSRLCCVAPVLEPCPGTAAVTGHTCGCSCSSPGVGRSSSAVSMQAAATARVCAAESLHHQHHCTMLQPNVRGKPTCTAACRRSPHVGSAHHRHFANNMFLSNMQPQHSFVHRHATACCCCCSSCRLLLRIAAPPALTARASGQGRAL